MSMQPKAPMAECETCPLNRYRFVPSYIPEDADGTIIIGEAPGEEEARAAIPFIGRSGKLLQQEYERAGGDWSKVARTNVVLCRPPGNRTPTAIEQNSCAPRLRNELTQREWKKIATAGATARNMVSELLPDGGVVEGAWWQNTIGMVHPAFVLRQPAALKRLRRAVERLVRGKDGDELEAILQKPPIVTLIRTKAQLRETLESMQDGTWVAFDLETNQTGWFHRKFGQGEQHGPDSVLCLAFTTGPGYGWIIPDYILYDMPGAKEIITNWFARIRTIAHNGKFDVLFLRSIGIKAHLDIDTMILHYCIDETPGTHALKPLVAEEFGVPDYEAQLTLKYLRTKNDFYSKIPERPLYTYAVWDVCATFALAMKLKAEAVRQRMWSMPFRDFLMPGNAALTNVEWRGVRVDIPYLLVWKERLLQRAKILSDRMAEWAEKPDFNPGSHVQMKWLLFQHLGLPITEPVPQSSGRGVTKRGSTGKDAIKQLKGMHPIIELIGEYRTCLKMVRSYINNLLGYADQEGRVHTNYSSTTTVTGRLASRYPALQQIPKGRSLYGQIIRAAFIPRDGYLFADCDYAQAELRVFAAETRDEFLCDIYENDLDLHEQVVIAQWGPVDKMTEMEYENRRFIAKIFNFGWAYGGGVTMLTGVVPDPVEAAKFVEKYEENMPQAAKWRKLQAYKAQQIGYVQSRLGRRRRNLDGNLKPTEAINSPIQVGASDCTFKACIRLDNEGKDVVLLVHDQLVVEVRIEGAEQELEYVIQVMQGEAAAIYPEVPWKADGKLKARWAKELTEEQVEEWLLGLVTDTSEIDEMELDEIPEEVEE